MCQQGRERLEESSSEAFPIREVFGSVRRAAAIQMHLGDQGPCHLPPLLGRSGTLPSPTPAQEIRKLSGYGGLIHPTVRSPDPSSLLLRDGRANLRWEIAPDLPGLDF